MRRGARRRVLWRWSYRTPSRRAPLAGRTSLRSPPDFKVARSREGKTVRSIRMTLSLAFLAPEIVKAAVEGRLPRGFGLKRLVDLPMAWPDQWRALRTPSAGAGVRNDPPLLICLPARGLIRPSQPVQMSSFEPPRAVRNRAWWWTRSKQQPWKRKFAARDFRRDAPDRPENRRNTFKHGPRRRG